MCTQQKHVYINKPTTQPHPFPPEHKHHNPYTTKNNPQLFSTPHQPGFLYTTSSSASICESSAKLPSRVLCSTAGACFGTAGRGGGPSQIGRGADALPPEFLLLFGIFSRSKTRAICSLSPIPALGFQRNITFR